MIDLFWLGAAMLGVLVLFFFVTLIIAACRDDPDAKHLLLGMGFLSWVFVALFFMGVFE